MKECGVVAVIIALVGLVVTVSTPVVKLSSVISKLIEKVDMLINSLNEVKSEHRKDVSELREADRIFDKRLTRVETRMNIEEREEN